MSKTVRRRGFTLPEVLVTVTVVAVLAAVVVPAVTQFASKGDAPGMLSDLGAIRTGVTSYVSSTRTYPATLSDIAPYAANLSLSGTTSAATYKSGGYGLTIGNLLDQSANPGYITLTLTGPASHGSCTTIDTEIDQGTGATSGSFRYSDVTTNPCPSATYILMPK